MSDLKYSKKCRLTTNSQIKAVLDYRLFSRNDLMAVYIAPNDEHILRFAVSVSAKTTNAVRRNRLKRLARRAFAANKTELHKGFDYLIIFSRLLSKTAGCDINSLTLERIEKSFMELVCRCHNRYDRIES